MEVKWNYPIFTTSTFKKEPEEELDWIEKVLGRREQKLNYSKILEDEIIKQFSEEIAKSIDDEIINSIKLDSKKWRKYEKSQMEINRKG